MNILNSVFDTAKDAIDQQRGTDLEKKVKQATSTENWGASTSLKNEIAQATFDYLRYKEVMPTLWKRMSDNPTNWRINYKGLQLLDHLIRAGSDKVIQETRERSFMLRQLQDFQCVEEGVERGSGVRTLSKQICDLVNNEKALKELRTEFAKNKNKYVAASSEGGYGGFGSGSAGAYDKPDDSGFSIQADPKQKKKKKKAKKEGSDEEEEKPKKPQDSDEEEEVPKKKKEKKNKKKEESEDEDGAKKGKSKSKEEEEAPKKAKAKEDEEGKKKKSKAKTKEDDSSKKSAKAFDKPFEFEEEEEETPKPKKKIEIKLSDKSSSVTPPRLNMPEESGSSKTVGFGLGEDWFAPQAQPKVTKSAAPSEDDWGDFGSATVTKAAPKAKHDDDFGFSDFTSAPTSTAKSSSFEPKPVQSQDFSIFSAPTVSSTNQNNFLDFDTLPPVNVFVQSQPQSQFQPQFQSQSQPQSQSQQTQQKPKANDDPWAGLVDLSLVDKPKEKRHITMNSGR